MELFNLSDDDFVKEGNRLVKTCEDNTSEWRKEAEEDFNFAAGNQWDVTDIEKLTTEKRPVITFNRCNVIISAILGMEANQRQEVKFNPRGNNDIMLSESLAEIAAWARDYADVPQEEAQAFEDMLTCGMGWSDTAIEYDTDLDGKITQDQLFPLEMRWDTLSRKRNLADARWVARKKRMSKSEIEKQFPDAEGLELLGSDGSDLDDIGGKDVMADRSDRYKSDGTPYPDDEERKGLPVVHFLWYETAPVYRVANPQTGEIAEISEDQYKQAKDSIKQLNIPVIQQNKRKYYYAFFSGNVLLEKGESKLQTAFRFQCMTGKRDHINKQWFGIVRLMKDPQRWANKFFSTFIDIIDSNSKGGIMAEVGAFDDVRKAEEAWSRADSIVWMKSGAIAGQKVTPKPVAQYPQAIDRLMQFSIQAIHDVSGVNLELLGAVDRGDVGMVVDSRKRSAYTILAPYFDALKNFRKQNGRLMMECINKFIPIERITEILDDKYKQYAPLLKQMDMTQINIIIAESPQSDNNRMMSWQFIQNLLPQLIPMGIPIPPSVFEYSPLPPGLIQEWKTLMEQAQQSKQRDPRPQLALEQGKAEIQRTQAEAQLKQAQAMKTQVEAGIPQQGPAEPQKGPIDMAHQVADLGLKQADTDLKKAQAAKTMAEAHQSNMEAMMGQNVFGRTE